MSTDAGGWDPPQARFPAPVHEMESTPGPKYSTMAPVPPLTVRMLATLRMTSVGWRLAVGGGGGDALGARCEHGAAAGQQQMQRTLGRGPAVELAGELDTDGLGALELPRDVGHDVDSVRAADTDGDDTKTACRRRARAQTEGPAQRGVRLGQRARRRRERGPG